jgi:glycosyltransferase involved in cell wall biosynthesis
MEAMSAKCIVVAPEYAALSETMANFGYSYSWDERADVHLERFSTQLDKAIVDIREGKVSSLLEDQKNYADNFFSWDKRIDEWVKFLSDLAPKKKLRGGFQWL